jgi:NAD dependent epimerase/dehydratase family enzyme
MTKKKIIKEKKYAADYFIDYMVEKWKKNGTVANEEKTREVLMAIFIVLVDYKFECALKTIIEVHEEMDAFDWDKY